MPTYPGVDGAELHYDVRGGGDPPLIALAGGAGSHPDYLGDLAGLSEHQRLVVPHLRGVGRSLGAPLGERASWWGQAEDVEQLRVSLGMERCALVAHSAGTRLAVAYAAQFPERVSALLLITPPASYLVDVAFDAAELAADRAAAEQAFAAAMAAWETGPGGTSDEEFNAWEQVVAPLGYARWDGTAQAHARASWYVFAANRAYLTGDPPPDLVDRLRAVDAPVLVLAGAEDAGTGTAPVVAVANLFPHGRAVVIERSGHFPWVEQPAAFRAAVDPFLADLA